jgi:hypothetical protein
MEQYNTFLEIQTMSARLDRRPPNAALFLATNSPIAARAQSMKSRPPN